jgi:hypothetical protein
LRDFGAVLEINIVKNESDKKISKRGRSGWYNLILGGIADSQIGTNTITNQKKVKKNKISLSLNSMGTILISFHFHISDELNHYEHCID